MFFKITACSHLMGVFMVSSQWIKICRGRVIDTQGLRFLEDIALITTGQNQTLSNHYTFTLESFITVHYTKNYIYLLNLEYPLCYLVSMFACMCLFTHRFIAFSSLSNKVSLINIYLHVELRLYLPYV